MGKAKCVFERVEKKYLIPSEKCDEFVRKIEEYVLKDEYPLYTIANIYYDTADFELIRASIEKPIYKEKLRLRSYGKVKGGDRVFLELKKKYDKTVFKRRVVLTEDEATAFLEKGVKPKNDSQILREISYFINVNRVEPKVYLSYERQAFKGKDSDLRITVDKNLIARTYDLSLEKGVYGDIRELAAERLIEIKTATAYPVWLADLLCEMEIYPTSYSKYGEVYKKYLFKFWRTGTCLKVS